jgi:hypothetical protein
LEVGQADISCKVGALEVGQADINCKFGFLLELKVRRHASRMFGDDLAGQITATSIVDLVQLLLEDFVLMSDGGCMSPGDHHILYMATTCKAAIVLLEEQAPERLLRVVHAVACRVVSLDVFRENHV